LIVITGEENITNFSKKRSFKGWRTPQKNPHAHRWEGRKVDSQKGPLTYKGSLFLKKKIRPKEEQGVATGKKYFVARSRLKTFIGMARRMEEKKEEDEMR